MKSTNTFLLWFVRNYVIEFAVMVDVYRNTSCQNSWQDKWEDITEQLACCEDKENQSLERRPQSSKRYFLHNRLLVRKVSNCLEFSESLTLRGECHLHFFLFWTPSSLIYFDCTTGVLSFSAVNNQSSTTRLKWRALTNSSCVFCHCHLCIKR